MNNYKFWSRIFQGISLVCSIFWLCGLIVLLIMGTEMGQHNWECRTRHDARQVVPNLARQMGVPIYTAPPPGHTPTARSSSSP